MSNVLNKIESTSKTHLNNIMQIAVFKLNGGNYYGINVSKIRSFEDASRYRITENSTVKSNILEGYIQYQGRVIPVLNMEKWLGNYKEGNTYHIYLVCEYNKTTVAFPIASIYNIMNVGIEKLQKPDAYLNMVTYNTILEINNEETTCMVLDVEQLLFDTFGNNVDLKVESDGFSKKVLVAEDSHVAQEIVGEILSSAQARFDIFSDGQELIEHLEKLSDGDLDDIGLIVTDLEMPRKDGYQVIRFIKETPRYKHIPVLVNSSMSNKGVDHKTETLGVQGFIAKTDPERFIGEIEKNILR